MRHFYYPEKDLKVRLFKRKTILSILSALTLVANGQFGLAENGASAQNTAETAEKPGSPAAQGKHVYVKEEPVSDPAGSSTRVHRPGQGTAMPPLAPSPATDPEAAGGLPADGKLPDSPMPLFKPPAPPSPKENYPSVGQLEQLMFGHATPAIIVENRLDKLETAIFQRRYGDLDIEARIRRLKEVIVGEEPTRPPGGQTYASQSGRSEYTPVTTFPPPAGLGMTLPDLVRDSSPAPFFPNYGHYDLNQQLSIPEAAKFAVNVINEKREQQGLNEFVWDEKASLVAQAQVDDLMKRDLVSHQNGTGENPDLRYTKSGGSDAMVESIIMFPAAENLRPTRQLVVKMLESLCTRQDDREALMNAHATGFALAFQWSSDRQKLLACTEVTSKHGQMEALPLEAKVGDKIEVKGSVSAPYKFQKITLAWEGLNAPPPEDSSEISEAMPYFPPLDYEVHSVKSNKDYDKGIKLLQLVGIAAAIAGGVVLPPVALAAPLIAATITVPTPKPVSEIPVKGGVKTDGTNFSRVLTLNNQGKEGIYYVTIWATGEGSDESVAISRRTIIAHKEHSLSDSAQNKEEPKAEDRGNSNDDRSKAESK
jgi:hypothetical protein